MQNVTLCLNRIAKPDLPLPAFLELAASLGMSLAEVRNDMGGRVLDGLPEAELRAAQERTGVRIFSINALYPFESGKHLEANVEKLRGLIAEARGVGCRAIVMCPYNERQPDGRSEAQRAEERVAALDAYGPLLAEAGMIGLVEALGFERSALRTKRQALEAIDRSTHPQAFALLHDTFHHYLAGERELFPTRTGLVHVSGVPAGKPVPAIEDDDRVLVDGADVMDTRGQVAALLAGGCTAPISFEPFSPAVRAMAVPELQAALRRSMEYLLA